MKTQSIDSDLEVPFGRGGVKNANIYNGYDVSKASKY